MTTAAEILSHACLPAFLLVRNLQAEYEEIFSDARKIDGHVLGLFDSFEEAQARVPVPLVPTDPQKRLLFKHRFGEIISLNPRTGKQVTRLANGFFDTSPCQKLSMGGNLPRDRDIFGERYTIVWVCPADLDLVIERLIDELLGRLSGEHSSLESQFLRPGGSRCGAVRGPGQRQPANRRLRFMGNLEPVHRPHLLV